jgi:hypothetical protein
MLAPLTANRLIFGHMTRWVLIISHTDQALITPALCAKTSLEKNRKKNKEIKQHSSLRHQYQRVPCGHSVEYTSNKLT